MKRIYYCLPMITALLSIPPQAGAQSAAEIDIGFGTAHSTATGAGIDGPSSPNSFGACSISSGDSLCQATPSLGGLFMNVGGDIMFSRHLGVGAEFNFQPAKSDYGPLQYRQTFIDGNLVYEPFSGKRWGLQLQGGLGTARTGFSLTQSSCVGTAVCVSQAQPVGAETHFQVHAGAGVNFFLTEHVFIRPEFDLHYVNNLTQQFGSNAVPAFMFNIGYSSGREK
jgi:hypothetical protein